MMERNSGMGDEWRARYMLEEIRKISARLGEQQLEIEREYGVR